MPFRPGYDREDNSPKSNVAKFEQALYPDISTLQGVAEFQVSPNRLIRQLLGIVSGLVLISTLGQISRHIYHHRSFLGLIDLFYVDAESNIPTAFASFTWMLCSLTSVCIAFTKKQTGDRFAPQWQWLAFVFAYLALDELAVIHELLIAPFRDIFKAGGFFYYTWVIPGGIFVLFFVFSCFNLLRSLPVKTRGLLILSGMIFVTGAIGVEMIGGWYSEIFGDQANLTYALIATAEETLEMLGVLTLLYALLSYMSSYIRSFKINLVSK
jgi:hypothetical protein